MIAATLKIENSLWHSGFKHILGIDEVGRGSWAGPLVLGGVILPVGVKLPTDLADSKKLSPKKRQLLAGEIFKIAKFTTIAEVSHSVINKYGLSRAIEIAFKKITDSAKSKADFYLIDAFSIKNIKRDMQLAITKGDEISASIAAASIIAKVYRDDLMQKLHVKYPVYNFAKNKGYGTRDHQSSISKNGFCEIHRTSFNLNYLIT